MKQNFILLILISLLLMFSHITWAETKSDDQKTALEDQIQAYQKKLNELHVQKDTLSSQIQFMDAQIYLNTLKVTETEQKIVTTEQEVDLISSRITGLDSSLNLLSKHLIESVVNSYKQKSPTFFDVLLGSDNAGQLFRQVKYAQTNQSNSQKLLVQVQEAKLNFEEQKKLREAKKIQLNELKQSLDQQKSDLANQKIAKQKLLDITNNDEKTYQAMLNKAKAEYAAIETIVTIGSNETKMGDVIKGEKIASIIPGPSCNSGGAHTHFIVKENNTVMNPFNYLKPVSFANCSGSSCGSSDGDSFNPSGSWDWPLNPGIELEQGFGSTWATRNTWVGRIYNFHNGIDINGASNDVLAVADGTLYRGGFAGSNGCTLPYVKLIHANSTIATYYLHVYAK